MSLSFSTSLTTVRSVWKGGDVTDIPGFENFDRFGTKEQRAKFFAIIGLIMVAGDWDLPSKTSLNVKFPNIKPLSARKILEQA